MRVLLDQECAVVAGGHESRCEEAITGVSAAAGGVVGGIVGTGAGGVGAVPGAVGGFTAGAAVGEVVNGPVCRWAETQPGKPVDPRIKNWYVRKYLGWQQSRFSRNELQPGTYGPHELVADGSRY